MNTGIQGSSATPVGAWTTTTPGGKSVCKKDLLGIAIAHGIPYCASASIANIPDLRKRCRRQRISGAASAPYILPVSNRLGI